MKIETYTYPRSSFLAVEKDLEILVNLFMKNERLMKLLYYDVPQALSKENVPEDKKLEMFGKQIKIVPKLKVDQPEFCYLIIRFDNFTQNRTNPEFRDSDIIFDIVCHFDQWQLGDFSLRPYKIAAEIDSMIRDEKMSGIGTLLFFNCNQIVLSDEFSGLSLRYEAIHGYQGEDSKDALNPQEWSNIVDNFDQMFNN